jgi:CO/xanthine dehydrogenase FAD-binding subunit
LKNERLRAVQRRCSRIALSAVASHPLAVPAAGEFPQGKRADREILKEEADLTAKPLDNADLSHFWRKRMVHVVVEQALEMATTSTRGSMVKLSQQ